MKQVNDRKGMIIDFFQGFLGLIFLNFILLYIFSAPVFYTSLVYKSNNAIIIYNILVLGLNIIMLYYFSRRKKFIFYGMIPVAVIMLFVLIYSVLLLLA